MKLTGQKGFHSYCYKIFNHLPSNLLELQENKAPFMSAFRKCLLTHVFYPVEEFLVYNNDKNNFVVSNITIHSLYFYILTQVTHHTLYSCGVFYLLYCRFVLLCLLLFSCKWHCCGKQDILYGHVPYSTVIGRSLDLWNVNVAVGCPSMFIVAEYSCRVQCSAEVPSDQHRCSNSWHFVIMTKTALSTETGPTL